MRIRTESAKLRRQLPFGDVFLAEACLAHRLPFTVDADWRRRIAYYRFPYATLKRLVWLHKRGGLASARDSQ